MRKTTEATIIFPHQLFHHHPAIEKGRQVWLVEEFLFFRLYEFHKQKLAFHRASMKYYESHLLKQGLHVTYVESKEPQSDVRKLLPFLKKQGIEKVHFADVTDEWLNKRIEKCSAQNSIECIRYDSPLFINSSSWNREYMKGRKKYFQADFYSQQRKRLDILMEKDGTPVGGKWSFDAENRLKYPKNQKPPAFPYPPANEFVKEAVNYVDKNFPRHYGVCSESSPYPVTHEDAEKALQLFLKERFHDFGIYEDAMVVSEHFLHHSVLSPLINVGLLLPMDVVNASLVYSKKKDIPMNSLEGFIRQVIGWREFVRAVYEEAGTRERKRNFWGFSRNIPASFWSGTTGIGPVDITIRKILQTGYCHHIERLMVLGNFMVLCEFDPDEVYRWFMEMFIDAYDWVMVPNVYGMSQFADGGLLATKPYISGSNYLMKMSDFPKGEWQAIWDALFWRFMHRHRDFFSRNPRLGMLVKSFDKMEKDKQTKLVQTAEKYLQSLDQLKS